MCPSNEYWVFSQSVGEAGGMVYSRDTARDPMSIGAIWRKQLTSNWGPWNDDVRLKCLRTS